MELSNFDKLAAWQALYKTAGAMINREEQDSLRADVDRIVIDQYENSPLHPKTNEIYFMGEKVGTISVTINKEKTKEYPVIEDNKAFINWIDENADIVREFALQNSVALADFAIKDPLIGEIPAGVKIHKDIYHARVNGTTLRIDEKKVFDIMRCNLPGNSILGLLGGDSDV